MNVKDALCIGETMTCNPATCDLQIRPAANRTYLLSIFFEGFRSTAKEGAICD